MRGVMLVGVVCAASAMLLVTGGCASRHGSAGGGPYVPITESDRNGERARRLNAEGAKLIDSDPARAETLLRDALTADLYCGPAHNNLGVLYLKRGDLYSAAGEFEWAKKLLPGLPDPRMNLAITLERAGRTDEALATYATALEVYPDHLPSIEAMAMLQVRSGKIDDRTRRMLEEIALCGESGPWREWARFQMSKADGH